jgi:hypothetical protein
VRLSDPQPGSLIGAFSFVAPSGRSPAFAAELHHASYQSADDALFCRDEATWSQVSWLQCVATLGRSIRFCLMSGCCVSFESLEGTNSAERLVTPRDGIGAQDRGCRAKR